MPNLKFDLISQSPEIQYKPFFSGSSIFKALCIAVFRLFYTNCYDYKRDGSITYKASRTIINAYVEIKRYPATFTQREVFYGLRDELALADENGALAYVLGNVDGQPFNNIYQLNGVRYFRNGETDVLHVQWNQDVATGKVITILFTRI